ncbi:SpoIID/LytB domain-containing protein [Paenibacillus macerans]|uniref:SpoIID/LytB domain-containing protein n=1 Tax=Paenibacillus macerans TaxID=44252 RepID=UPI003D3188F2
MKRGLSISTWGKGILAGLLLAGTLQLPAAADDSDSMRVRVAMYLDLGSTYKSTTPAVTLKTEAAAEAGMSVNASLEPWLQLPAGDTVRFSVSGFKVKALESTDWKTAAAAIKKLQGTADKPVAYAVDRTDGTAYRIYTGPYASEAEAQKAADRVGQTLSASYKNGGKAEVRGSFYVSAGSFASQAEAQELSQTLNGQNAEAFVVMSSPQQFAVWVGGAANASGQTALQAELAGLHPGLPLAPVDAAASALIQHRDVTLHLDAPAAVNHYELSGEGAKLLVRDEGNAPIQVVERSARKYRGDFEISKVNGQLALVNEVPLEQYLYSVVAGEVPSSWPQEALKAQAVAARSYALYNSVSNKFKVAGLVDTTLSQVYNGTDQEVASIVQAVDNTAGEVIVSGGNIVEGIFSSNSGGVTADATEVWSNANPIYSSVPSMEDQAAQASLKAWYHVLLSNGSTGYVREDNTAMNGTTPAGLQKLTVTTSNVLVRKLPLIQSDVDPVAKLNPGDQAIVLDKVDESSSYAWIRGPFSSDELLKALKGKTATEASSPILNLEVTRRGPSGRVTEVEANGRILDVKYPDSYRSALNGLPSTLFDIVPTGRYTVQGAGGSTATGMAASNTTVLSAAGKMAAGSGDMVVMGGDRTARVIEPSNRFVFVGHGNGHGLGLSQWGAKGMADAGYDYRQILQHYYQNVTIVKE